jgi:hypothetical protein
MFDMGFCSNLTWVSSLTWFKFDMVLWIVVISCTTMRLTGWVEAMSFVFLKIAMKQMYYPLACSSFGSSPCSPLLPFCVAPTIPLTPPSLPCFIIHQIAKSRAMLDGLRGRRTDLLSDIDKARIEVDRLANLRAALVRRHRRIVLCISSHRILTCYCTLSRQSICFSSLSLSSLHSLTPPLTLPLSPFHFSKTQLEEIGALNTESAGVKGGAAIADSLTSLHTQETDRAKSETALLHKILAGMVRR